MYSPEDPLLVYGVLYLKTTPLILRLFAPDGTIKGFEQISADIDGIFNHILLTWPEPSTTFPYGTYSIENSYTTNEGILGTIDVRFGPNENDEIVISSATNTSLCTRIRSRRFPDPFVCPDY